jgi:hypothetical protein
MREIEMYGRCHCSSRTHPQGGCGRIRVTCILLRGSIFSARTGGGGRRGDTGRGGAVPAFGTGGGK